MADSNLDRVRAAALARIERAERTSKLLILLAVVVEAAFLLGFAFLADFRERTHVLILLAAVGVYTLLVLGLFVLGTHVSRCTGRVLESVELLDATLAERQKNAEV